MTSNHRLTALIQGRTIAGTANQNSALTLTFDDQSKMTVQTAPSSSNSASNGGTIKAVRQAGTTLSLDFESGGSMVIQTAEETSSVMLRDKNSALEYAD